MKTRNEASQNKAHSMLPEDLNQLMKEAVISSYDFPVETEGTQLKVSGKIYPQELIIKFSLSKEGALRCHNFSASIDHDTEAGDIVDRIQDCIEALSSMMAEHIQSTEIIDFPLDWHEYTFNKQKIYLRYSTENDSIEEQAAALLGDEFSDENTEMEEFIGKDFFKEAEERFKENLH